MPRLHAIDHTTNPRAPRPPGGTRPAATVLECALTLPVLLVVLLALLDLGLAATRYNALAEAARRIAREVVMHGTLAGDFSGTWGPEEFSGTAADGSLLVQAAQGLLPLMPDEQVAVRIRWLDNDNTPRDRVRVELRFTHEPLLPVLLPWGALELAADSTMRIVN